MEVGSGHGPRVLASKGNVPVALEGRAQGVSEGKGPALGRGRGLAAMALVPEALLALRQMGVGLEVSSACWKVF